MGSNFDILSLLKAAQGDSSGLNPQSVNNTPDLSGFSMAESPSGPPAPPQSPQTSQASQTPQLGPRLNGIKGYLSNIFYNMGEGAKAMYGIPTDREVYVQNLKLQNEQMQTKADVAEKQARSNLYNKQANQVGKTVMTPYGELPIELAKTILPAQIRGQFTLDAAKAKVQAQQNQMTFKAAYGPDGQVGLGMYDKAGNFRGMAENAAVPPEYLEKIRNGQEAKFDANGNLYLVPTTSTTKPVIPAAPGQPPAKTGLHPTVNNLLNGAKPVTNAKPVMVNGQQFQGPTAADVGTAYDPNTNENYLVSRTEAAQNGYQNFTKASAAQQENYRQLNNRLADVQQKIDRFEQTSNQPLSAGDKYAISKLMSDQHFEAAFKPFGVGVTIPTGFLTELDRAAQANGLSPQGRDRLLSYLNAREAMVGYQRVLSGSGRGNEKQMEMLLQTLPSPITDSQFANEGFRQFKENLKIAGQGLPKMRGVQSANDIEQRNNQEPSRPPNVPANYVYKVNGPKGTGWYRP